MTRRPAVTLIEVLVSMFIMAIGMLALLVLFPLGAISMGQALKDDRAASTASMAENVAIAWNIRHDASASATLATGLSVYIDPNGTIIAPPGNAVVGTPAIIPNTAIISRVSPGFFVPLLAASPTVTPTQLADRWFSLPDDITFYANGSPDLNSGFIDRGRRYSFAYLLTAPPLVPGAPPLIPGVPQSSVDNLVQLSVVVYSGRAIGALTSEPTYQAAGTAGSNGVVVNWTPPLQTTPNIKFGSWILDTTFGNTPTFYRVVNITDVGANSMVLEVQPNLKANIIGTQIPGPFGSITVMENVVEVFDKGTSWQP
jgi:hypothetical protein